MLAVTVHIEIDSIALLSVVLCILRHVLRRSALIFPIRVTMANVSSHPSLSSHLYLLTRIYCWNVVLLISAHLEHTRWRVTCKPVEGSP